MGDPSRACGSCSACCGVMGVEEIPKAMYEPCEHLCDAGCGVYAERPEACRTFECQWLRGALEFDGTVDPELRPDACGVIFDFQPLTAFGDVFTAWEVEPGASRGGGPAGIIEGLAKRFLVMIVTHGPDHDAGAVERRFLGPPHLMRRAKDAMGSRVSES